MEAAVNISAELVQAGKDMIEILRSHDRNPYLDLQQSLEDRRMANYVDMSFSCHTPKEQKIATKPK